MTRTSKMPRFVRLGCIGILSSLCIFVAIVATFTRGLPQQPNAVAPSQPQVVLERTPSPESATPEPTVDSVAATMAAAAAAPVPPTAVIPTTQPTRSPTRYFLGDGTTGTPGAPPIPDTLVSGIGDTIRATPGNDAVLVTLQDFRIVEMANRTLVYFETDLVLKNVSIETVTVQLKDLLSGGSNILGRAVRGVYIEGDPPALELAPDEELNVTLQWTAPGGARHLWLAVNAQQSNQGTIVLEPGQGAGVFHVELPER